MSSYRAENSLEVAHRLTSFLGDQNSLEVIESPDLEQARIMLGHRRAPVEAIHVRETLVDDSLVRWCEEEKAGYLIKDPSNGSLRPQMAKIEVTVTKGELVLLVEEDPEKEKGPSR